MAPWGQFGAFMTLPTPLPESFFTQYFEKLNISKPTKIQSLCLEPLYHKQSVFGLAPTGSGKTLAFVLPLLLNVETEKREIQTIILVPTRELGSQIARVCQQVSDVIVSLHGRNILVRSFFGGNPIAKHVEEISKKPHVIVCTPGRLIDLLERDAFSSKTVKAVVLDEADIMVGMGFAEQVKSILNDMPKTIQIALFSATQTEKVTDLENELLKNKSYTTFNAKNSLDSQEEEKSFDSKIEHQYVVCSHENKLSNLVSFLKQCEKNKKNKIILFCHQRETTHELSESLKKEGFLSEALTGELGQVHRNSIMRNFKSGTLKYLVATNIASRGIDVSEISCVIHYDVPFNTDDYIHRSGRTGRSGFEEGLSVAFCNFKTKQNYLEIMKELHLTAKELKLSSENQTKKDSSFLKQHFVKIHLNKGKQDKIRPGDILGAFIKDFGLEKEDIGSIFIFNNFTHVEVSSGKKNLLVNKSLKIKAMSVRIVQAN